MFALSAIHFILASKKWSTPLDALINSAKNTAVNKISAVNQNLISIGFWLLVSTSPPTFASDCLPERIDQYTTVSHVYDGDTIKLKNGKNVRLIGINTPEMNYKTGVPEPYAKKARDFLRKKLKNQKIGLLFGPEKKDRYGRLLAHVFLQGEINLQQALLSKGFAINIAIPPNLSQQDCYLKSENRAKANKIGLWKNHFENIIDSKKIKKGQTGFKFVKGNVTEIIQRKKAYWLKLSNKLSLRINQKNLKYFTNLTIDKLKGKNIIARGWINYYQERFNMNIKHPDAIEIF